MSDYKGSSVYDDDEFFEKYIRKRALGNSPNDTLEKPIISQLVNRVQGRSILDIGCGDGLYGKELLDRKAKSFVGIDGSQNMCALARKNLEGRNATILHHSLETFDIDPGNYDLVISRLVLHYVQNLNPVLERIHQGISSDGEFICSIEHPILTSCYDTYHANQKRGHWVVDDYFKEGQRINNWNGKNVIKYHRTIETYWRLFKQTGFDILDMRESKPIRSNFKDQSEFERRSRIPLFLFFKVRKH